MKDAISIVLNLSIVSYRTVATKYSSYINLYIQDKNWAKENLGNFLILQKNALVTVVAWRKSSLDCNESRFLYKLRSTLN